MKKNSSKSIFVNKVDLMERLKKSEQMAQRIMREIRALVQKTLKQLVTVLDYAKYFGLSEDEAKDSLGRDY